VAAFFSPEAREAKNKNMKGAGPQEKLNLRAILLNVAAFFSGKGGRTQEKKTAKRKPPIPQFGAGHVGKDVLTKVLKWQA
jgi:hypothetical protein